MKSRFRKFFIQVNYEKIPNQIKSNQILSQATQLVFFESASASSFVSHFSTVACFAMFLTENRMTNRSLFFKKHGF